LDEAGLPPGVINIVHGRGEDVGRALVEHVGVDMISFTGSRQVGIEITQRAAPTLKKTILELGGKNCIVVLDDARLDLAVKAIIWSAFGTSGQRCTSASRIIATRGVYHELVDRLATATAALKVGPGLDESTDVGPLINRAAVNRVQRYVDAAESDGAELLVGGQSIDGPGFYFQPTLFAGAEPGMQLVRDEIFGPLTAVMAADDFEHAVQIANDTMYGLSASVFTENIAAALSAVDGIETGLFYVNAGTTGAEAHLPTGGMKASGNGHREAGLAALESYTEWRSVYIDYSYQLQRAQIDIDLSAAG
jgi:aldehyde dehydrogenase (NAD+)